MTQAVEDALADDFRFTSRMTTRSTSTYFARWLRNTAG